MRQSHETPVTQTSCRPPAALRRMTRPASGSPVPRLAALRRRRRRTFPCRPQEVSRDSKPEFRFGEMSAAGIQFAGAQALFSGEALSESPDDLHVSPRHYVDGRVVLTRPVGELTEIGVDDRRAPG